MKKLVAVVTVALALLGSLAYAAENDAVGRAEDAAKAWPALKAGAVETITPMHEKDGSWRVAGYYMRER
jgi:hypothetical protein